MKQSGFALILLVFLLPASAAYASSFSDVPETSPYYNSVESLKTLKIISGYPDGTFRPSQPVNRAEALKMIMNSAGIYPSKGFYSTGFKDITIDAWFAGYVMNGLAMGIVSGNPDGTFAPGRNVNKAEFLKIMIKTYQIDLAKHLSLSAAVSSDSKLSDWFTPYLSYAKTVGLVYPDLQN
ncbi:MAG TPA: S-layer homology domain-containing protein, partial [Candidatus Gracilibacteria bacterium]|nr:S-layer homology domain-containing protein [Candidatus Gracilibacteria bacterium]